MNPKSLARIFVATCALSPALGAEEHSPANPQLTLSAPLLELLREEMREITAGVQAMGPAIATGNWELIRDTSSKIRASYIMERKPTPSQSAELGRALPDEFKRIDAEFHHRAEKLRLAATSNDAEQVIYHYSRMLESCTLCHARFATSRFPAFGSPSQDLRHH